MNLRPIKVLSALVFSLGVAFSAAAEEDTFTVNSIKYRITSDNEVEVSPIDDGYRGSITIPSKVTYSGKKYTVTGIGEDAFFGCSEVESVNLPESLTYIGIHAFESCSSLTEIDIPDSVNSIAWYAFERCGLREFNFPASMTRIEPGVLSDCYSLEKVTIPESVTEISYNVFYACGSLREINLPENLTSIDYYTFSKCTSLTSITLPSKLTFMNVGIFEDCTGLQEVTCLVEDPWSLWLNNYVFEHLDVSTLTLKVPVGSEDLYSNAFTWSDFGQIIPIGERMDLVDATTYDNDRDIDNVYVTYTRNFKNTNWQPLYVPYNMAYEEWCDEAEVAKLYNIRGYDKNGDGEIDDVTIEFSRVNSGEIYPNVPYIIRAKSAKSVTFTGRKKTLLAKPDEESYIECSSTKYVYGFYGIYDTKSDMHSSGAYTLTGGSFALVASDKSTLKPYRFYMIITPKAGGYNSSNGAQPQKIRIMIDGEEQVDGLEDLIIETPTDDTLYDLMGRKVQNPAPGIYIRAGKKVMIK